MEDERRKRFSPYVRCLADKMGLRDWTTCISQNPPDDTHHVAEAECLYGQKWINVYLSEAFFRKDESEQRQTICHELIHAHVAPMSHYLRKILNEAEGQAYQLTMEYAVDGMATEWARHLPLPRAVRPSRPERGKPMGRQKPKPAEPKPTKPKPKGKAPAGKPPCPKK